MTAHDARLLFDAAVGIVAIVALITAARLHAFLALTIGSILVGLLAGHGAPKTILSFESGVGGTLGYVGIIVALGTMLGKLLADSGGADMIAQTVLRHSGVRRVPWAMALIAMVVGIPLFFEIGLVLLLPIVFTMARQLDAARLAPGGDAATVGTLQRSSTYLLVGIPALAGLSVLHGLVPPHPGPLVAIHAINADLGTTMFYGILVAIPTVIIAGPVYGTWVARRVHPAPSDTLLAHLAQDTRPENPPTFRTTLFTILLPVVLMLARTVVDVTAVGGSTAVTAADFVGDPVVALLIAVLVAMWTFGLARGIGARKVNELVGAALAPAAGIILIIGAGGGFKQVLIDAGIGGAIAKAATNTGLPVIVVAWLVAVLIRVSTGSATVATVTAAGIVVPLVATTAGVNRPLVALAIGAGSLFFSHVNDAGFWLVKEFFGMSVKETVESWSVMETIISVVGLLLILLLSTVA
ncbi:MAG TPA: gluconate:H+ symporter [Actinomycetota bacterium]